MTNPYESPSAEPTGQEAAAQETAIGGGLHPHLRLAIAGSVSFAAGFGVWLGAHVLLGSDEPWDASYPLYSLTMLIVGSVIGYAVPGRFVAPFFSVWVGQLVAIGTLPWLTQAHWWQLTMIATGIGSLFIIPGLLLGWGINAGLKKLH